MTMCNVKGPTYKDKPTDDYHLTLQFPLSSTGSFSNIQLVVLDFTVRDCLICLTNLFNLISSGSRQLLTTKNATCSAPNGRQKKLVTSW